MEDMVREPAVKLNWVSPKVYLESERLAAEKHEYFEGEIVVKHGASLQHEDIVANFVGEAGNKLKGKNCRVIASNLRTASPFVRSFMYPDASIVCGEPQLLDEYFDVLLNPKVVIEVVSKSSITDDYNRKWAYYRQMPSLQEYVLINSYRFVQVDIYRRNEDNTWTFPLYDKLADTLELQSIGISISLADIYENTALEALKEADNFFDE